MELLELDDRRSGEPVVLIHGFAASAFSGWVRTGWAGALARAGFRPLGVDLPGHGRCALPSGRQPSVIGRAELVEGVGELVAGVGADHPVPLVGYSLGAQLAWAVAARGLGVGALVLGGLGTRDRLPDLARALEGDPAASPAARAIAAALTGAGDDDAGGRGRELARFARSVGAYPFDPAAAAPTQPALLFAGALDPWARPGELARLRRAAGPGTEQLLVAGRGHVDVLTARAARAGAVEFLRRSVGPGRAPGGP